MTLRGMNAVAHRLSTVSHLDRLVVLANGRIVEEGTHQALLAAGGVYARLWERQSGGNDTRSVVFRYEDRGGAAARGGSAERDQGAGAGLTGGGA